MTELGTAKVEELQQTLEGLRYEGAIPFLDHDVSSHETIVWLCARYGSEAVNKSSVKEESTEYKWIEEHGMTASPEEGDVKLWLVSMGIVKSEEEATDLLTNHLEPEDTMEKLLLSCKAVNQALAIRGVLDTCRMGMNAKDLSQRTYFESKPITKEEVNYPRTLTCRMRGVKDNAAMLSAGPREAWIEVVNNTTGAKTRLNVMAKMDDSFAIEISGPDDSITVDLDIEETRVGTAMLPVGDAEFVTLRKETADNDNHEIAVLDATQDDATTATFVMQCHWQDDDHVLRESGAMFYRVLRTPFKSAKKGIKLVNSPWEGAAPTKYSLRVGERFRVNERVTDTNGMVWVHVSEEGAEGWVPEAVKDEVGEDLPLLELMSRNWTKASASKCLGNALKRRQLSRKLEAEGTKIKCVAAANVIRNWAIIVMAKARFGKNLWAGKKINQWLASCVIKKSIRRLRTLVSKSQALVRRKQQRREWSKITSSVIKIQKVYRGHDTRWHWENLRKGITATQARWRGIKARYPFGIHNKGVGYFVEKEAANKVNSAVRMFLARCYLQYARSKATIIQSKLIRPIIARKVCFDFLQTQIQPRVIMLNQMQKQNKTKIALWRRLAKRCCPAAIDYHDKVILIAGGMADGVAAKVAKDFVEDESVIWTRTIVVLADADLRANRQMIKGLRLAGVGTAIFRPCNLLDEVDVKRLVAGVVQDYGQLDVLVNLVTDGGITAGLLKETKLQQLKRQLALLLQRNGQQNLGTLKTIDPKDREEARFLKNEIAKCKAGNETNALLQPHTEVKASKADPTLDATQAFDPQLLGKPVTLTALPRDLLSVNLSEKGTTDALTKAQLRGFKRSGGGVKDFEQMLELEAKVFAALSSLKGKLGVCESVVEKVNEETGEALKYLVVRVVDDKVAAMEAEVLAKDKEIAACVPRSPAKEAKQAELEALQKTIGYLRADTIRVTVKPEHVKYAPVEAPNVPIVAKSVAPNLAATTPSNALSKAAEDERAEFTEKEKPKQGVNHSPYACFKACMPHLRSSKYGIVVNICPTETMAEASSPLHSKSGLLALTELISRSFPDIKCNAINPTTVPYNKQKKELTSEVASMVGFLTNEGSPFMTGQSFTVQGWAADEEPLKRSKKSALETLKLDNTYTHKAVLSILQS